MKSYIRLLNILLSSFVIGVMAHEIYHAIFYKDVHFIGLIFGDKGIAKVCGIGTPLGTNEPYAYIVGGVAIVLWVAIGIWARKK